MTDKEGLRKKLYNISDLPTLPVVVSEILRMVSDTSSSSADAAELILTDQALTSKILRVVNSAYYGFSSQVNTVTQAVVLLGFDAIKNLLLSVSVFELFTKEDEAPTLLNLKKFWGHSLGTAVAGELIARHTNHPNPEEVFVAGLLHDLGKIILCLHLPTECAQVLRVLEQENVFFHQAEKSALGIEHGLIGKWVAEKWNLPPALIKVIQYHHYHHLQIRRLDPYDAVLTAIIKVADAIVKQEDIGQSGDKLLPKIDKELLGFIGLDPQGQAQIIYDLKLKLRDAAAFLSISPEDLPDYLEGSTATSGQQPSEDSPDTSETSSRELCRAELAAHQAIARQWQVQPQFDEMLQFICTQIQAALPIDRIMLAEYMADEHLLHFDFFAGEQCPEPFRWQVTAESQLAVLIKTGTPVQLNLNASYGQADETFLNTINSQSCLVAPIHKGIKLVALLLVDNPNLSEEASSSLRDSLLAFAGLVTLAYDRATMTHSLADLRQDRDTTNQELTNKMQHLIAMKNYNQLILESMTNGIVTINKERHVIVFNQSCEYILGLGGLEVMGRRLEGFPFLKELDELLQKTMHQNQPFVRIEIVLQRPSDNRRITLGISTAPLQDKDQKNPVGAIAIFRDLTQFKQMQTTLSRRAKLSALGEMAAALAHEIRNPLNPIKGFAQLMDREIPKDDPRREYTQIIIHEVDRLRQMLTHFLEFTHTRELHLTPLDLNEMINDTMNFFCQQDGTSLIMFKLELGENLPLIAVDVNYLKQVLLNLVQNATDALLTSRGEGGEITIRTSQPDTQHLAIEVIDNGPGIPADVQEHLFEPFFTTKKDGTGLGLSTCYRIIEDHHGELSLQSNSQQPGSIFIIKLPLEREEG